MFEARRQLIQELVQRRGFVSLDELVGAAGVSESTIRRDLDALGLAGSIRRTHGGAIPAGDPRGGMPAFDDRADSAAAEKRAIGRRAAELVGDGDTVLLDGGTTTLEVARALAGRRVQVVTNSLPIAHLLAPHMETDLVLIGGFVYPRTGVALGPIAIECLREIRVHTLFMGAGGIVGDGVFNSNLLLVETELAMMRAARQVVLVADHTKFGKQALTRLCGLSDIQRFVVDAGIDDDSKQQVQAAGVALEVVPVEPSARSAPGDQARSSA